MNNVREYLFKSLTFSKGFLYGFVLMFALPRSTFDKIAIAYYDFLEPEASNDLPENIIPSADKPQQNSAQK
jgi:hypothetical protein